MMHATRCAASCRFLFHPALLLVALGSLAVPAAAGAQTPRAYLAAPESLKDRTRWEVELQQQGADLTLIFKGNHQGGEDCVQKPPLKVKYNQKKARLKTRQMEPIRCKVTEQSATITPKRRAFEFFVNGDIIAFIDVEGGTNPEEEPVKNLLLLPSNPQPGEPAFALVPVQATKKGCYSIGKIKAKKKGTDLSLDYTLSAAEGCLEEHDSFQIVDPLGPLGKGKYTLKAPNLSSAFGVGVTVAASGSTAVAPEPGGEAQVTPTQAEDPQEEPEDPEEPGKTAQPGKTEGSGTPTIADKPPAYNGPIDVY